MSASAPGQTVGHTISMVTSAIGGIYRTGHVLGTIADRRNWSFLSEDEARSSAAGMEAQQMTKDFVAIGAGMLVVGLGVWSLWGHPQNATPAETQEARILADDPALKLVSEQNPYMRTER